MKPSKRVKVTEQGEDEADTPEAERVISGRRRAGKFDLPDVLPAEFLTDSEGEGEDDLGLLTMKRPRKITFDDAMQTLSKEGRAPKDEIVGSTAYRVMADQSDQKLTPRANHNSQNVKEMLLHRRRVGVPPNQGKSFFKRK